MPIAGFATSMLEYPAPKALNIQQIVSELRAGGMPVAAIADAMKVERKTIYSWLSGGDARLPHAERAVLIHSLLTSIPGMSVRNIYRFWNTPVAEGNTLRSLVSSPTINRQLVASILTRLRPAAKKARDAERKMSRIGIGNPILDELPEAGG